MRSSSRYKGVYLDQGKWRARIRVKRRLLHLGSYAFEPDAAVAYNTHAGYLHGEFSRLNKIPEGEWCHE
jgi:hypothetical protein